MKKKIYIIVIVLLIGSVLAYNYIYKDHRDISTEKAAYTISANKLLTEFITDVSTAQDKYLNKTIEITGKVTAIDKNTITLNNSVFCSLLKSIDTPKINIDSNVIIKGRCIGFDDLLEEVKFDQSTIKN